MYSSLALGFLCRIPNGQSQPFFPCLYCLYRFKAGVSTGPRFGVRLPAPNSCLIVLYLGVRSNLLIISSVLISVFFPVPLLLPVMNSLTFGVNTHLLLLSSVRVKPRSSFDEGLSRGAVVPTLL